MSVLHAFRAGVIAAIAADSVFSGVQVLAVPPGENEALKESVFVQSASSAHEFRGIGVGQRRIKENIELTLAVRTYSEGPDHLDAGELTLTRAELLSGAIGNVIADSPTIGGVVSFARMSRRTIRPVPAAHGWAAEATVTVSAESYPDQA